MKGKEQDFEWGWGRFTLTYSLFLHIIMIKIIIPKASVAKYYYLLRLVGYFLYLYVNY